MYEGGIGMNTGMGQRGQGNYGLPNVSDPEQTYANITRDEYMSYIKDYRNFEQTQIDRSRNDTSLIDQAKTDAPQATQVSQDMQQRSIGRYGVSLTPAQQQEMQRTQQRQGSLGYINALSNSRIAQKEANTALLSDLINIGQGVNRSSQSQLASAASDANARNQAYDNAKAQSKQSTIGAIGAVGSAALAFLAF